MPIGREKKEGAHLSTERPMTKSDSFEPSKSLRAATINDENKEFKQRTNGLSLIGRWVSLRIAVGFLAVVVGQDSDEASEKEREKGERRESGRR